MKKLILLLIIAACGLHRSFSQSLDVIPTITEADIINASVLVDPLAEKIKDIAPTTFSLMISNLRGVPVKASMEIEAFVTLEEDRQRSPLFNEPAKTKGSFLVPPGGRIFTSKEANSTSSDIDIRVSVNEPLKKKLKDKILEPESGGRVPSGLYEMRITVTVDSVNGAAVQEAPIVINRSINVTNPTTTVLIDPSRDGTVYTTPFPQFQWIYDTRGVIITIYELRPEHQSMEDAIGASDAFLQVRIDRKLTGNLSSFTYPQSATSQPGITYIRGPRQLEHGKRYVIVLDGVMSAFGYEVDPLRTIRAFAIADPQGQVIINVLQTAFSGGDFQSFINLIQDLNLQVNVNSITLNGITVSPQDLQKLLLDNKDKITSIRFED